MKVAVLAGGRSSEHEISLASAAAIRTGLEEAGHDPVPVEIAHDGRWSCGGETVTIAPSAGLLDADVVFPALHGPFGEDGTVQGLLELADVPYVGAGVLASALCMDKVVFKDVMAHASIPQVAYRRARAGDDLGKLEALGLPVFVKPARLGSSVGISKAGTAEELRAALEEAWGHDPLAIVEALSRGMEVECSVIGNDDPIASEPGELVVNAEWYDYAAKYEPGGMDLKVPARLEDATRERVRELAVEVFKRAGCTGLARVDFFVEDGSRVLVNELNTMPGFTQTSVFPKLFEKSGVPFPDLLNRLVELAIERHERERTYRF
ncbi:MAG: D-alanine--D-alanine ligase family protein [Thermoleophilaceae bacterium]